MKRLSFALKLPPELFAEAALAAGEAVVVDDGIDVLVDGLLGCE
jgi:hypothetical protein